MACSLHWNFLWVRLTQTVHTVCAHWAPREAGMVLPEVAQFLAESKPLLSCCSYSKCQGWEQGLLAQGHDLALPDLSSPFSSRQE